MTARPWTVLAGALSVSVRATPKGGRDAIDGVAELSEGRSVLKARVRAAPADGEANDALVRLLAKTVGVAPRAVTLLQGAAARNKTFRIDGDPARLAAALERALGEQGRRK
ncbi:MAG TPA: DUF167 family protein [Xanthobacteraceae bacterium]|nr:DUF167 family protein [Xanthobacteraceae bacterium]